MVLTNPEGGERGRHPWLTTFAANPQAEAVRLLTGFAAVNPYRRADAPDVADLVFGPLPVDDPLRRALGEALIAWLMERRRTLPEQRAAYGIDPFVREASDAFRIVSRLELVGAARQLRSDFHQWDAWTRPLMLTPARDARRAYLQLCALMQTTLGDDRLEPVWLDLCRAAGRDLFDVYLSVGLLGLRRMPAAQLGFEPAKRVAIGLAVWARAKRPPRDDFMREWRAIRCLYPRAKPGWQDIVEAAVETAEKEGEGPFQAATWWRKDIQTKGQRIHQRRANARPPLRPVREAAERLQRERLSEDLISTVKRLVDEREWHAIKTAESEFVVKTACNFARHLIYQGARGVALAHDFVRRALNWEDDDGYTWALWAQVLEAQDDRKDAELVAWEAVRRFPEQADKRCLLARLLAVDASRWKEAEALLRETIKRFPENEYAPNQLAKLLAADPAREVEAETLLKDTIRQFPNDQYARNQLAKILAADPARREQAEEFLRSTIKLFENSMVARNLLAGLLLQQGRTVDAGKELDEMSRAEIEPHYFALRHRWAYQAHDAEAAQKWLEEGLERFPSNSALLQKLERFTETGTIADEDDDWFVLLLGADDEGDSGATSEPKLTSIDAEENLLTAADELQTAMPNESLGRVLRERSHRESSPLEASTVSQIQPNEDREFASAATADQAYMEALRHGRVRRADFALNGAGLDMAGRLDARADLEAVLRQNGNFIYGHLVALRRLDSNPGRGFWVGLGRQDAVEIARAWDARELQQLDHLARHSAEGLLARCAAALAGDEDAKLAFAKAIVTGPRAEGRGSRALRRSLRMPLEAYAKRHDVDQSNPEPAPAYRIFEDQPDLIAHVLTEAIDASFDYGVAQV